MAKKDFDKKSLDDFKKSLSEVYETQQKLGSNMSDYVSAIEKLGKLTKNIKFVEEQRVKSKESLVNLESDLLESLAEELKKSGQELKLQRKITNQILKKKSAEKSVLTVIDDNLSVLKKQTTQLAKQVKQVSVLGL